MIATHGIANTVGFAPSSILAWRRKAVVYSG